MANILSKYRQFLLIPLFAQLFGLTPAFAVQCRSLFSPQTALPKTFSRAQPKSQVFDAEPMSFGMRTFAKRQGRKVTVIENEILRYVLRSTYEFEGHFEEIVRPLIRQKPRQFTKEFKTVDEAIHFMRPYEEIMRSNESDVGLIGNGTLDLFLQTLEALDFSLVEYQERKSWPAKFLRQLILASLKYSNHSTFVMVREKTAQNTPGRILGQIRFIESPYVSAKKVREAFNDTETPDAQIMSQVLQNELHGFKRIDLDMKNEPPSFRYQQKPHTKLWEDLFAEGRVQFGPEEGRASETTASGDLRYIRSPMEEILKKDYLDLRDSADGHPQFIVEPGLFAILPKDQIPESLRDLVAPSLYFQAARILRQNQRTTAIGTYASETSTSFRFYKYLGMTTHDKVTSGSGPTAEPWMVLKASPDAVETGLTRRLSGANSADLQAEFQRLNEIESAYTNDPKHFFNFLAR